LPDIEAQLAPNNYTYSHSLTYGYDNYTNTGIQGTVLSDQGAYYLMQAAIPMAAHAKLYLRVRVTQSP